MIVDYIRTGVTDAPLIRLYGYTEEELHKMTAILSQLSDQQASSINFTKVPFVLAAGISSFVLQVGPDCGVSEKEFEQLEWSQSEDHWHLIASMIREMSALIGRGSYHQWLAGPNAVAAVCHGPISVVITDSPSGEW